VSTDGAVTGATRADAAHAELKRRLLSGEFPLNVRLGEERLAALAGVSRTPIREALLRLHAEGLVNRWSDGGFRPVAPDVSMMRNTYEARAVLERQCLRLPASRGAVHDPVALDELLADWRMLAEEPDHEPDPGFVVHDEAFHVALATAAGNPVVVDLLRQVNDRIRLVRMQDFLVPGRIDATIAEHLGIVEALRDGRVDVAEQLFDAHIGTSIAVVEDRVARAITRMAVGSEEP
jgi:DNA-binding GntR family transcriptional regulator